MTSKQSRNVGISPPKFCSRFCSSLSWLYCKMLLGFLIGSDRILWRLEVKQRKRYIGFLLSCLFLSNQRSQESGWDGWGWGSEAPWLTGASGSNPQVVLSYRAAWPHLVCVKGEMFVMLHGGLWSPLRGGLFCYFRLMGSSPGCGSPWQTCLVDKIILLAQNFASWQIHYACG